MATRKRKQSNVRSQVPRVHLWPFGVMSANLKEGLLASTQRNSREYVFSKLFRQWSTSHIDGAVWTLSQGIGGVPSIELFRLSQFKQVPLVVALNGCSGRSEEQLDRIEIQSREILESFGFEANTIPVVRIDAHAAALGLDPWSESIDSLFDEFDNTFAINPNIDHEPTVICPLGEQSIGSVARSPRLRALRDSRNRIIFEGQVVRGTIKANQWVQIHEGQDPPQTQILSVSTLDGEVLDQATTGMWVHLTLSPVRELRGFTARTLLSTPGSLSVVSKAVCRIVPPYWSIAHARLCDAIFEDNEDINVESCPGWVPWSYGRIKSPQRVGAEFLVEIHFRPYAVLEPDQPITLFGRVMAQAQIVDVLE